MTGAPSPNTATEPAPNSRGIGEDQPVGTGSVSIVIGQAIKPGREDDYVGWQRKLTDEAARFPGYLSSELNRPTDQQPDWTAIYRFDSVANAKHWLDSPARQNLLDKAEGIFAGPGTRQIIADGTEPADALVTVLASHQVPEDKVDEFLRWQDTVAESLRGFAGFRGIELFRPIQGVQGEWNVCLKFDSAEHLDSWLLSDERQRLIHSAPFGDFKLRSIDHSFGNWFALGDGAAPPPSNLKTSIAVWLGLYPTVTLLTLMTMPFDWPLWLNLLIGNLVSSFVMSYITMPYYGNPILRWWLRPRSDAPQPRTDLLGVATVLAINAAWAVFFIVLTGRVLHMR